MKKLESFCKRNRLILVPVSYTFQGLRLRRKGFDICFPTGEIFISLEPIMRRCSSSHWLVRHAYKGYEGPRTIKYVSMEFLAALQLDKCPGSGFFNAQLRAEMKSKHP